MNVIFGMYVSNALICSTFSINPASCGDTSNPDAPGTLTLIMIRTTSVLFPRDTQFPED